MRFSESYDHRYLIPRTAEFPIDCIQNKFAFVAKIAFTNGLILGAFNRALGFARGMK